MGHPGAYPFRIPGEDLEAAALRVWSQPILAPPGEWGGSLPTNGFALEGSLVRFFEFASSPHPFPYAPLPTYPDQTGAPRVRAQCRHIEAARPDFIILPRRDRSLMTGAIAGRRSGRYTVPHPLSRIFFCPSARARGLVLALPRGSTKRGRDFVARRRSRPNLRPALYAMMRGRRVVPIVQAQKIPQFGAPVFLYAAAWGSKRRPALSRSRPTGRRSCGGGPQAASSRVSIGVLFAGRVPASAAEAYGPADALSSEPTDKFVLVR